MADDDSTATPTEALENAAAAIKRLDEAAGRDRSDAKWSNVAVVVVCVVAVAGLLIHTFLETEAPVDGARKLDGFGGPRVNGFSVGIPAGL